MREGGWCGSEIWFVEDDCCCDCVGQGNSSLATISDNECARDVFVGIVEGGGYLEEGLNVGDMCDDDAVGIG